MVYFAETTVIKIQINSFPDSSRKLITVSLPILKFI